ncbi:MAG TPA: SDR family oxidoreductase, partial [Acidimicrobiales bacterium]|nr:SDR family oxidoreductase [Acidimicrobiales bacterium]
MSGAGPDAGPPTARLSGHGGTGGLLGGKVVVVTGGGAGIGGAVTRRLAAEGALLVVNDIEPAHLDAVTRDVTAGGGEVVAVPGDIRSEQVVEELARAALAARDGRVDVLVNNVGDYRPPRRFLSAGRERWQELYAVNLEHVFACTYAIAPAMVASHAGSIVNVSTVEASRGIPRNAVYSAFNAGVEAFTRSLAVELGPEGVRVNAIAPDLTDTLQTPAEAMLGGRDPALVKLWLP